jgi:uncharacterized membrane protein YfcA
MLSSISIFCIFLIAGFTQGVTGFGFGLLAIPLLTFIIHIKTAIPLCSLHGLLITGYLSFRLRHHIDKKKIVPLLVGCLPGIGAGVFFLKKAPSDLLAVLMGIMLISYSLYRLFAKPVRLGINPAWAYIAGFCTGAIGSAFSAGGPPTIIYTTLTGWNKDDIKATLSGFFLAGGIFIALAHALNGLTTVLVLRSFAMTSPAVVLGVVAGSALYNKIDTAQYVRLLLYILLVMGFLMLRSLFSLL